MNIWKNTIMGMVLLIGGTLTLPAVPGFCDDVGEEIPIISRTPSKDYPFLYDVEVEGGLRFQAPPDMIFVKRYGVIDPIFPEEYTWRKIEVVNKQIETVNKKIEALNKRIDELERKSALASAEESQRVIVKGE